MLFAKPFYNSYFLGSKKTIDDLVVAAVLPLSGIKAQFGKELLNGIIFGLSDKNNLEHFELDDYKNINPDMFSSNNYSLEFNAISSDKKNKSDSNNQQKIILIIKDNEGDINKGEKYVKDLLTTSRATVIIGGFSSDETYRYSTIANNYNAMYISLLSAYNKNLSDHEKTVVFKSSHDFQINLLAQYFSTKYNIKKKESVILVKDKYSDESKNLISSFYKAFSGNQDHQVDKNDHNDQNNQSDKHSNMLSFVEKNNLVIDTNDLNNTYYENDANNKLFNIIDKQIKLLVVCLSARNSYDYIKKLYNEGYKGFIAGLDFLDHPLIKNNKTLADVVFISQYDQSLFNSDIVNDYKLFKSIVYPKLSNNLDPNQLVAYGFDVINWIKNLYITFNTTRLSPWLHFINSNVLWSESMMSTVSNDRVWYKLGADRHIKRQLVISHKINSKDKSKFIFGELQD